MNAPFQSIDAEIQKIRNRIAGIDADLSIPTTALFFGAGLKRERELLEERLAMLTGEQAA